MMNVLALIFLVLTGIMMALMLIGLKKSMFLFKHADKLMMLMEVFWILTLFFFVKSF